MPQKISILIIAFNAEKTLPQCLQSLMELNFPHDRLEIVVVDNASTDKTPEIIKSYPVKYVYEPQRNRARARNTAIKASDGDVVAFIDADCIADKEWLHYLVPHFYGNELIGAVAGRLNSIPENLVERYIAYRGILDQKKMLAPGRCCSPPFAVTANLAIRRQVFEKIGLFDADNLPIAGEDADFCWRMQWAGFKLVYEPRAVVWHKHRSSLRQLFSQTAGYGFGNVSLFAKHRQTFQRRYWIDFRFYIWLIKAVLKLPFSFIFKTDEFERKLPLFDCVANCGIIYGKIKGSLHYKCLVL